MCAVHTLVAEVLTKLVNTVEATHDEALEVELGSYSHIEIGIESIVMRDEGSRRSTTRDGLQDGCLHLHVAVRVEELTHSGHNLGTLNEHLADVRVNHQVNITLTVAHLGVCECVKLLAVLLLNDRQGTDRL